MKFKKENKQEEQVEKVEETKEVVALTETQVQELETACDEIELELKKQEKSAWWKKAWSKLWTKETMDKTAQIIIMSCNIIHLIKEYKKGAFKIAKENGIKIVLGALCMVSKGKALNTILHLVGADEEECKNAFGKNKETMEEIMQQFKEWVSKGKKPHTDNTVAV